MREPNEVTSSRSIFLLNSIRQIRPICHPCAGLLWKPRKPQPNQPDRIARSLAQMQIFQIYTESCIILRGGENMDWKVPKLTTITNSIRVLL